jgi:geranylgeranyl diphosphate synthase type II
VTSDVAQVRETLAHYAGLTKTAMVDLLPESELTNYLDDLVRDYPTRPGKGIRPALLLATCQAFGGSLREGLRPAVALELLHNAFLVHDDIEDDSRLRRGRPTLHDLHGVGLALNAGDALAYLALRTLRDDDILSNRLSQRLLEELLTVVQQTTAGQALELGWRRDNIVDLEPADYLDLVAKKTCWYSTVAPVRMGALVGSWGTADLRALTRFGFYLGTAFQIRDDLLDLEAEGTGKEPMGDIREGKRTLLLLHLLANAGESERAWLIERLAVRDGGPNARSDAGSTGSDNGDDKTVRKLMERYGSVRFAEDYAAGIAQVAHESFAQAFAPVPASEHVDFLRGLVDYVLLRDR